MRNRLILAALVVTAMALVAAGCGSSNSSGGGGAYGGGSKQSSTTAAALGGATVSATKNSLGTILTGPNGHTLYMFAKDSGGKSACSGGCAAIWPPLTAKDKPTAGSGVDAAKLGTTAGANGAKIVTYNGHPLYYYVTDKSPGDTTGQAINSFGADWFVLGAQGNVIKSGDDDSGATTQSSGGGGGMY